MRIFAIALVCASTACGGVAFEGSASDGGADANADGATDAGNGVCPSTVPSDGAPCAHEDAYCEYGNDPHATCNTIAHCTSGAWSVQYPFRDPICGTHGNDPRCPSSFTSVPQGKDCADIGLRCDYAEAPCGCVVSQGPPMVDGGGSFWYCAQPAGCPAQRPKLGSPCTQGADVTCDYGMCYFPDGMVVSCRDGAWAANPGGCAQGQPPPGGRP